MIMDDNQWVRLIEALTLATQQERLEWVDETGQMALASLHSPGLQRFTADTRNARYVLNGGGDSSGGYKLTATDTVGLMPKLLGEISATVSEAMVGAAPVPRALADLYREVESRVESSEDIVDRLLGDL